jgi:hypothetical protein
LSDIAPVGAEKEEREGAEMIGVGVGVEKGIEMAIGHEKLDRNRFVGPSRL